MTHSPRYIGLLCNQCGVQYLAASLKEHLVRSQILEHLAAQSGGSDSAALPVHLGLRDEASALQPLHSGTCNVHRGLTRGLWKSPESFSSILNDWVGLKLSR